MLRTIPIIGKGLRLSNLRVLVVGLALSGLLLACSDDATPADEFSVVVTTTILGDVTSEIVGSTGSVDILMPPGIDPHDFDPSAAQVAAIRSADLVVANGLDLEEGLLDVLESASSDGIQVIYVGESVAPLEFGRVGDDEENDDEESDEHEHEHGFDPHFWMDPTRMQLAAEAIGAAVARANPDTADITNSATASYLERLSDLDGDIVTLLAGIADSDRLLVTNHDSLGYFADRYGFVIVGVVIPGGNTLAEPSSADISALIRTIERHDTPAIFVDTSASVRMAEVVASEVGGSVEIVELFTGSLGGDDSQAATYIDMMLTDGGRIANALSEGS